MEPHVRRKEVRMERRERNERIRNEMDEMGRLRHGGLSFYQAHGILGLDEF